MIISLENPETKTQLEIVLVGTAHVSRESIDEVNRIIQEEKPDLICVELDKGRYASMTQKDSWENLNVIKAIREGKGFLLMANLVLAGFQRRMGAELGVKPGEEMKAALDTAKELDIPHALCDREVQITLRRAWANCSFWNKNKLLATLVASAFTTEKMSADEIENLKKRGELDGMMNELAAYLPEVKETLIDERDQYLAAKIWSSSREQAPCKQAPSEEAALKQTASGEAASSEASAEKGENVKRVVAVVGAGHMMGIKAHLKKIASGTKTADTSSLETIPPKRSVSKALPFLIPAVILSLIVFGFVRGGADMTLSMLRVYILWNGSLAAFGALLALAHPLAILAAFVTAPITTFTPFLGVGLFSGDIQVALKKPRVSDAQTIIDDVGSFKGFYRNRITHSLLVFFLTQLGGVAGTFVTIPALTAGLLQSM